MLEKKKKKDVLGTSETRVPERWKAVKIRLTKKATGPDVSKKGLLRNKQTKKPQKQQQKTNSVPDWKVADMGRRKSRVYDRVGIWGYK